MNQSSRAIAEHIAARAANLPARRFPVLLGLNGAQGSGKSTLSDLTETILREKHCKRALVLSLDDFYLPKQARQALAQTIHPLCGTRGVPGTHDVPLILQTLARLFTAGPASATPQPRFSKLADDRLPATGWPLYAGRPDVIIFEGWCIGIAPDRMPPRQGAMNRLEEELDRDGTWFGWSLRQLIEQYTCIWKMLDLLATILVPDLECVIRSRLQQEQRLLATAPPGTIGMQRADVERFVHHYERYTRAMWESMPDYADIVARRDEGFNFSLLKE